MSLSLLYVLDNFSQILVWFMVFNATFNNILAIAWRSVLLVEEIGVPGENNRLPQVTDKLIVHRVHFALGGIRTHNVSGDRH
jgi:hypothetical protein